MRARSAPHARAGRARAGALAPVSFLLCVGCIGWFVHQLSRDVRAQGFDIVRTDLARLDRGPGWFDPRWEDELRLTLARTPEGSSDDPAVLDDVRGRVEELSFVATVDAARVLWPDGLELQLGLREPVACMAVGQRFLTVAADGTLLSGRWIHPPDRDEGYLPVVVSAAGVLDHAPPGAVVEEGSVLDALSVADSMWRYLSAVDLARLGRIVIDATAVDAASVEEPGCRLLLEGGRVVLFGRTPNRDEPGELPVGQKWASLARALELIETGEMDWVSVDVRWDRPTLVPRGANGPGWGGER